jgi:hypothetical protein
MRLLRLFNSSKGKEEIRTIFSSDKSSTKICFNDFNFLIISGASFLLMDLSITSSKKERIMSLDSSL